MSDLTVRSPCTSGSRAARACCSTTATTARRAIRSWRRWASRAPILTAPRSARRHCSRRCCRVAAGPARPSSPRSRRPDETSVFFCRTDGGAGGLARGLRRARARPRRHRPAVHRPRRAVAALRLLRRGGPLLSLDPRPAASRQPGLGGTRRPAAQPLGQRPDRPVRLALTVPRLGGEHGPLADLQHVAFASHDAIAAARRMREQGVPLLAIPDNYYDDLAARTELDDAMHRDAARARGPLRGRPRPGSSCTSSPRPSVTACSSRWSSGAAPTTDTGRSTHPSGYRRSCTRWQGSHRPEFTREETSDEHRQHRWTARPRCDRGSPLDPRKRSSGTCPNPLRFGS